MLGSSGARCDHVASGSDRVADAPQSGQNTDQLALCYHGCPREAPPPLSCFYCARIAACYCIGACRLSLAFFNLSKSLWRSTRTTLINDRSTEPTSRTESRVGTVHAQE